MPYKQRDINNMYNRVLDTVRVEFTDIPADSVGAEAVAGLQGQYDIIIEKGADKSGYTGTAKEGTAIRAVARRNIRDYMSTLARNAEVIAREKPGFDKNFPSPGRMDDNELLAAARAVSLKAAEHSADFVRRGLTNEFVDSGAAFVDDFDNALDTTNEALGSRGAAVGGKNEAYEKADEFFDELDNFIRNRYRDNPAKLNAWKNASRIERSSGRGGKSDS